MSGPTRRPSDRAPDRMDLEPVKSTRIYEEIVRQVKQLIAEGRLKSGDRLPPERDLAEKFMVSRTSVREALRALQSRGLIDIRAGEGAFVRDVSVEPLIEPLALVILPHREAVGELFEARRLLEPAIAALAARRATREEISEMERIVEDQAKVPPNQVVPEIGLRSRLGRKVTPRCVSRTRRTTQPTSLSIAATSSPIPGSISHRYASRFHHGS